MLHAGMLLATLTIVAGCGEKASTVTGKVTYNGEPVAKGTITFTPSDGMGQVFAARIENGVYNIPNAQPGKRKVEVRGLRDVKFALSSEEAARLANEARAAGNMGADVADPTDYIPADAAGNNTEVEVTNGDQTLDFEVTGPPRRK
jgi:hypothetical protein